MKHIKKPPQTAQKIKADKKYAKAPENIVPLPTGTL